MFIFVVGGRHILHTGDFRADPVLLENPLLKKLPLPLAAVYLDTTYCLPSYRFPSQAAVIAECCGFVRSVFADRAQLRIKPVRRLVVVGTYSIGKERIVLALARMLGCKIYCTDRKRGLMAALEWSELWERLTTDAREAGIHLVSMFQLSADGLGAYFEQYHPYFAQLLAIKPTGWTFGGSEAGAVGGSEAGAVGGSEAGAVGGSKAGAAAATISRHPHRQRNSLGQLSKHKDAIIIYRIPYSEHSSFDELLGFVQCFPAHSIVPTVSNPHEVELVCDGSPSANVDLMQRWSGKAA